MQEKAKLDRRDPFGVTREELKKTFRLEDNPEFTTKLVLFLAGLFLSFVSVLGALWGYKRAYKRVVQEHDIPPVLGPLLPIQRVAMIIGAILFTLGGYLFVLVLIEYTRVFLRQPDAGPAAYVVPVVFIIVNSLAIYFTFSRFEKWRAPIEEALFLTGQHGTARYAKPEELHDLYVARRGLYIGGSMIYDKQGHVLTMAGTRGGKGVNLIIPNLLGKSDYQGSWVVIDPKGENAAITARYQRSTGRKVLVLDPWQIVKNNNQAASYNPLDLLTGASAEELIDDASVIAEMIVPANTGERDKFFSDRARGFITGMIVHMMLTEEKENQSLATIWGWLRLSVEKWQKLVGTMATSDNAVVEKTAHEIMGLMKSANTFGSVMATALQYTDFLKSPALQKSLAVSDFDVKSLSEGKTTLYVVIPADKLKSHYQWLRLVVTTSLRSVIRRPDQRVTFLLDEFAALGHLGEIEVALSTYAGYNVTIWAILQNLAQLVNLYGTNAETFISNTAVRQYFSIGDNSTAEYVSKAMGERTFVSDGKGSSRALATPDEVRRGSRDGIYCMIEQRPPTWFPKQPYWTMGDLVDNGEERWGDNPYFKNL